MRASSTRATNWLVAKPAITASLATSYVGRAKSLYVDKVGFHADIDQRVNDQLRFVQLTPPGSACSIVIGDGVTQMTAGTQKGLQVVVQDVEAARRLLVDRGVDAPPVEVFPWGSFTYFSDPDGNTWAVQQLPPRPQR